MSLRLYECFVLACLLALTCTLAYSAPTPPPVKVQQTDTGFAYYTLPIGSAFHVVLQTPINTSVSKLGDPVEAIVTSTIYLNDRVLFNKNTRLLGHISKLEQPIQGRNAVFAVHFDAVKLNNGETIAISGYIKTDLPDHSWGGELTPGTVPTTVVHSVYGIGQYGQTIMSGPRRMGNHIEFLPGTYWIVLLEKPLTLVKAVE